MMRYVRTWGPVAGTVVASAMLLGAAEPVAPRSMPPLPVPPVERRAMPPFLARITISGDPKMNGVFERCEDPAAAVKSAEARAKARPADAPPPRTGCTNSHEMRPDGSIRTEMICDKAAGTLAGCTDTHEMRPGGATHGEMSCDKAKGAKISVHMVSDGTPNDIRMHIERSGAGGPKTVVDSRMERLGPCPADLKPGQMRRPGGPVIERGEATRLLDGARGVAP